MIVVVGWRALKPRAHPSGDPLRAGHAIPWDPQFSYATRLLAANGAELRFGTKK